MSSDSPDSEIREFYSDVSLSERRIDAILSHGRAVAAARVWKRVAIGASLGFVGMMIFCGFLLSRPQDPDGDTTLARGPVIDPNKPLEPAGAESEETYRLIAVRSHGDRCPRCRAAGEVFTALRKQFEGRPLEFVLFDFQQIEDVEKTNQDLDALNVNKLLEGRRDKALLALAGPAGEIRELDLHADTQQLGSQIAGLIGKD